MKLLQQINLLTRKNLKIRFSHKCLTFCELFIPLFITAVLGIIISNGNQIRYHSEFDLSKNANISSSAETFACTTTRNETFWGDENYKSGPKCALEFGVVNTHDMMAEVKDQNITYLISEKLMKHGKEKLAEAVMSSVLKAGPMKSATNWTRGGKTEQQLEVCVVQHHAQCDWLFAAVIITDIEDEVETGKKFAMEYKIRMMPNRYSQFHTDRLFVDVSNGRYRDDPIGIRTYDYMSKEKYYEWEEEWPGFVNIQAFLDRGIMEYVRSKHGQQQTEEIQVSLVRMPYIQPSFDRKLDFFKFISLLYLLLGSLTIFNLMRVNSEKSSGFKELLRMHGVDTWTQWMAWLLSSFIVYFVWTFALALLFWIPFAGGPNLVTLMRVHFLLYWLLLLFSMMSITTFCYMVSVFFERVWTAASIGLVTWIVLIVIMMVVSDTFRSQGTWTGYALMLLPTVAFDFSIRVMINGGGSLQTLNSQVFERVPITTLHCLFMLLLDSVIFMTVAIYLDNVLPAKYGARKHPLYFLRKLQQFVQRKARGTGAEYLRKVDDDVELNEASVEMASVFSHDSQQPFESPPEHVEAAVVIHNLKKVYRRNKKRAVDGLSAKMFTGEIYALLGFNGAGKTTTIGVLTGLLSATDGTSGIFDLDTRKDMEEIRKYIGLCPQHNLLVNDMTVLEQVVFFGKLKCLNEPVTKAEELLKWLGLSDKLNSKPEELSGGQKRRVHLAIALIGDPKLAFLDEPTSGLDPESRRGVWDILSKLRGKMTTVLTTHDMEEADVLGDRIGIMSEGKMMCSGTPSFLKKYYGVGYNLKMNAKSSDCDHEKVYRFVRNYVPNAKLNTGGEYSATTSLESISICLPTADIDLSKVADLMEALKEQKDDLMVGNIGLSLSTMDEVFLKVGEVVHAVNVPMPKSFDLPSKNVSVSRYTGSSIQWYRFRTLVYKRMQHFFSAPYTLLFLVLFLSTIFWLSLTMLSLAINRTPKPDPSRVISSLSSYRSPTVLLHVNENASNTTADSKTGDFNYSSAYLSQLQRSSHFDDTKVEEFSESVSFQEILLALKNTSEKNFRQYREHFVVGASFNTSENQRNATGFFSAYALHSAPLSLNLISQTTIKKQFGVDAKIGVVNYPLPRLHEYAYIDADNVGNPLLWLGTAIPPVVIISLLTGTAALLPTEERLNKGKHLQLMTGVTPFIYWSTMFTWDFLFFSLVNVLVTLIYVLVDYISGNWIYTNNGAGAVIFLILECHSFAALWVSYLVSWAPCVKTASDGFLLINKLAIIVGILWSIIREILIEVTYMEIRYEGSYFTVSKIVDYLISIIGYVTPIFPTYSFFQAMLKITTISTPNSVCNWFPENVLQLSCDSSEPNERTVDFFIHSCCENCSGESCYKPRSYFNVTTNQSIFSYISWRDDEHKYQGVTFDIVALVLSGMLFAAILIILELLESKGKKRAENVSSGSTTDAATQHLVTDHGPTTDNDGSTQDDTDVKNEAARVEAILNGNDIETANHALIAHNLHLEFGNLKAVNGLSFGVHPGECLGLLGVNGAGKTSTFKMITGDIATSAGNIYSGGLNYYRNRAAYLSSLGYCPQFDGLIDSLTGLQMVKLYGALRGIPPERLQEDARIWLDKFGLLGSANKKCGKYSGGMKRRLSAAIAMIGNPKLLLLDEPTSGVDPAFRRQFWNVIREIRESGQSVLLTSHTMDECEALCTRLGIMVDGQFKCLGNIQHLKSKHGEGFILTVKLKGVNEEEESGSEEKISSLVEKIVGKFSPCRLQTKQKTLLQYQILNKSLWYSDIFRTMERIRNMPEALEVVEEYSVTETSLEDVFISFANKKEH